MNTPQDGELKIQYDKYMSQVHPAKTKKKLQDVSTKVKSNAKNFD